MNLLITGYSVGFFNGKELIFKTSEEAKNYLDSIGSKANGIEIKFIPLPSLSKPN